VTSLRATNLPPEASSVSAARRFAVQAAGELAGSSEHLSDASLLVSELTTNAVQHAATPIRVSVARTDDTIRFEVHDDDPTIPVLPASLPPADATSGRGIVLVDAIARAWGVDGDAVGKTVWFELDA
jgi:anti-sigma regulatory factor (Ser/Thr protein kinase)